MEKNKNLEGGKSEFDFPKRRRRRRGLKTAGVLPFVLRNRDMDPFALAQIVVKQYPDSFVSARIARQSIVKYLDELNELKGADLLPHETHHASFDPGPSRNGHQDQVLELTHKGLKVRIQLGESLHIDIA